jgi:hypothetical protein
MQHNLAYKIYFCTHKAAGRHNYMQRKYNIQRSFEWNPETLYIIRNIQQPVWQNDIKILNRWRKLFPQFQWCSGAVLAIPESPPLIKMEWYRHAQTAEFGDTRVPVAVRLPQNLHRLVWVRRWWQQWPAVSAGYRPTEPWHGHWYRPAVCLFVGTERLCEPWEKRWKVPSNFQRPLL